MPAYVYETEDLFRRRTRRTERQRKNNKLQTIATPLVIPVEFEKMARALERIPAPLVSPDHIAAARSDPPRSPDSSIKSQPSSAAPRETKAKRKNAASKRTRDAPSPLALIATVDGMHQSAMSDAERVHIAQVVGVFSGLEVLTEQHMHAIEQMLIPIRVGESKVRLGSGDYRAACHEIHELTLSVGRRLIRIKRLIGKVKKELLK